MWHRHKVSKRCWKNVTAWLPQCGVATAFNLWKMQYMWNVIKQSAIKWGMPALELNFLEIRNRCLQMASFSTAPRYKCLLIVLILSLVEGTFEFSAWKSGIWSFPSVTSLCIPWPTHISHIPYLSVKPYPTLCPTNARTQLAYPNLWGKIGVSDREESYFRKVGIFAVTNGRG